MLQVILFTLVVESGEDEMNHARPYATIIGSFLCKTSGFQVSLKFLIFWDLLEIPKKKRERERNTEKKEVPQKK